MLIGLSVSLCIRDIANNDVNLSDVDYIIAGINPMRNVNSMDDLPQRMVAISRELGRIATEYEKTHWRDLPSARHIFFNMHNRGKILYPRMLFDSEFPNIADGYWLHGEKSYSPTK